MNLSELILGGIGIASLFIWFIWVSFKPTDQEIARKLEILETRISNSLAHEQRHVEEEIAGVRARICTLNDRVPSKHDVEYLQRQIDKIAGQIENQQRKTK